MKKILLFFVATISIGLLFFAPTTSAACTENKSKGVYCCGGTQTSIDFNCKTNEAGNLSITSVLLTVINFLAIGVGIAVVGGIVYGAVRYITSDGNAAQAQQGISIIVNSVIGLLLFIFMYAIINFLVPGGLFT